MDPVTYVMIVLLASWTVALVVLTRWADKYIRAAHRYEAKSKELCVAQAELNASSRVALIAEKELYARLEKEIAGYESAKKTIEELKALYHDALDGTSVSEAQAECIAQIVAHAIRSEGLCEIGGLLVRDFQVLWPRYEWRALVEKYEGEGEGAR